ncbi:hypothetical protein Ciccas_003303 [Cichlidogyrus casuarinus]|uniref:Uncharacterized protein n=1 Tax=Cichlidogyrus casuarinus TaxID=1844966 RepID=A0ABD2QI10_9PLAT
MLHHNAFNLRRLSFSVSTMLADDELTEEERCEDLDEWGLCRKAEEDWRDKTRVDAATCIDDHLPPKKKKSRRYLFGSG